MNSITRALLFFAVSLMLPGTLLAERWTFQESPTSDPLFVIASSDELHVIGSLGSILTSPDAVNWTVHDVPDVEAFQGALWNGELFVLVGVEGMLYTSPDGLTWTKQNPGTTENLYEVDWNGELFVIVGSEGTVLTSVDGINWTPQDSGTTEWLANVVWNGELFLAVGWYNTIVTSPDGINWTLREAPERGLQTSVNLWLEGIVWTGERFIVGGVQATFYTSTDGINWSNLEPEIDHHLFNSGIQNITWNGSEYIATGQNRTLLTSPDGDHWTWHNLHGYDMPQFTMLGGAVWTGEFFLLAGNGGTIITSTPQIPEEGWWVSPSASSNGFALQIQNGFLFAAGFTYDAMGNPTFLTFQGDYELLPNNPDNAIGEFSSTLFQTENGPCPGCDNTSGTTMESGYGDIEIRWSDNQNGMLTWNGVTIPITRFLFNSTEDDDNREFNWWISPDINNNGFAIEIQNDIVFMAAFSYDDFGVPTFFTAQGINETIDGDFSHELISPLSTTSGGPCPGCTNTQGTTVMSDLGDIVIRTTDNQTGELIWNGVTVPIQQFRFN